MHHGEKLTPRLTLKKCLPAVAGGSGVTLTRRLSRLKNQHICELQQLIFE